MCPRSFSFILCTDYDVAKITERSGWMALEELSLITEKEVRHESQTFHSESG
jgi:hypothetical protein